MIAADTSSMVAFLEGRTARIPESSSPRSMTSSWHCPVVLTELLSEPTRSKVVRTLLAGLPILDVEPGFWERAGLLRAAVLTQK
jgi:predicted nucleic acid-binding protein